jgi:hypothetical protein
MIKTYGVKAGNESLAKYNNLTGYSQDVINAYFRLLNRTTDRNGELIDDMIYNSGRGIAMPMDTACLERYLSGYRFEYIPFNNVVCHMPNIEGFFEIDKEDGRTIRIYYNTNCNAKRQRYSRTHELWHVCQMLDMKFLDMIDNLLRSDFPPALIHKLMEKSADKATAIYLMPNHYFVRKFGETQNLQELSDYFQVSVPSIMYRMKECGLIAR